MPLDIVVGAQWGDEGKGRVVDLLARTAEYVARSLMERREKVLDYFLDQVSPLEAGLDGETLLLEDLGIELAGKSASSTSYHVRFFTDDGDEIEEELVLTGSAGSIVVPVPRTLVEKAGGYLRVDIRVVRDGKKAPRPAQFHVREGRDQSVKLVGVVH